MEHELSDEEKAFVRFFCWMIENDIPPGDVFKSMLMNILKAAEGANAKSIGIKHEENNNDITKINGED